MADSNLPSGEGAARGATITLAILVAILLSGALGYALFAPSIIEAAYNGESHSFLNDTIAKLRAAQPDIRDLRFFQTRGRILATRAGTVVCLAFGLVLAWRNRAGITAKLRSFFSEPADPLNLAITRIAVFLTLFVFTWELDAVTFARLPEILEVAPSGLGPLIAALPRDPDVVGWLVLALRAACLLAVVGLFTRPAAVLTALLSLYVLGLPQIFGKVNHYHHLVWFAALLAASRCADALSFDAIFAARRRADRGDIRPPPAGIAYGRPLRMLWLLFGLIYFFAGFHKLWAGGVDWIFSDNLKHYMYMVWRQFTDDWRPAARLDRFPLALRIGAIATIVFELTFVFAILFRFTRILAFFAGLAFHNMTYLILRIRFTTLQTMYVALVDWRAVFDWIGARLFPRPMIVLYDGNCRMCRRAGAIMCALDLLRRLEFVNGMDRAAVERAGVGRFDAATLAIDMYAVVGERAWAGYDAYRALLARMPLFWPIWPLLWLWPIPAVGRGIYRRVADTRGCSIVAPPPAGEIVPGETGNRGRPAMVVGAALIAGVAIWGIREDVRGWPFACYPTFGYLFEAPTWDEIAIEAIDITGARRRLSPEDFLGDLRPARRVWLVKAIVRTTDPDRRAQRLEAMLRFGGGAGAIDPPPVALEFFEERVSTVPEERDQPPLSRKLLHRIAVQ